MFYDLYQPKEKEMIYELNHLNEIKYMNINNNKFYNEEEEKNNNDYNDNNNKKRRRYQWDNNNNNNIELGNKFIENLQDNRIYYKNYLKIKLSTKLLDEIEKELLQFSYLIEENN